MQAKTEHTTRQDDLPPPETFDLYGEDLSYRDSGGDGPVVVLVHGITSSVSTWRPVHAGLAEDARVVSIDLLGHGRSSRSRGDHSLGAHAAAIRDLLEHLQIPSATFVGHSLGGGVVLQLTYLFPHLVEKIVLVASGGLGTDVTRLLRAAALPAADVVIPVLFWQWPRLLPVLGTRVFTRRSRPVPGDLEEVAATMLVLSDRERRAAFLSTLRSVVDRRGQYVSALSKLSRAASLPVLIVWGDADPVIPATHGVEAQQLLPGSRLEVIPGGHFPHRSDPARFVEVVAAFVHEQVRESAANG